MLFWCYAGVVECYVGVVWCYFGVESFGMVLIFFFLGIFDECVPFHVCLLFVYYCV